jgi:hypothetical protein
MSSSRMFFSPWMELRWSTVLRQGWHYHATLRSSQRGPLPTEAAGELARGSRRRQAAVPRAGPPRQEHHPRESSGAARPRREGQGGAAGRRRRRASAADMYSTPTLLGDDAEDPCVWASVEGKQPNRFWGSHLLAHQE